MNSKKKLYVDVTNFLDTKLNTGIQRVLKEFLYHAIADEELDLYIIYFHQDSKECILVDKKDFSINLNDSYNLFQNKEDKNYFFDLDRVWNSAPNRNSLYKKLKDSNFYIINYIYDLIPILNPDYFYKETKINFPLYIKASLDYSDLILFDSKSTQKDFLDYKKKQNNTRKIKNTVLHLGCDFKVTQTKTMSNEHKTLLDKKYILFVGTIEPRKKHKELLEVFEQLHQNHHELNLIYIGAFGWNMDAFKLTMQKHPLRNKSFHHLQNIDDETLISFYKNAFLVCYLSNYEGFGLPVVESLYFQNITITSNNSSLKEISKMVLFENSKEELYGFIEDFLKDTQKYKEAKLLIKQTNNLTTWNDFYISFKKELKKNI